MNPPDITGIERRFAALEARALRGERRLRAACSAALLGAVAAFALGYHRDAVAQGYTMTLAQAAARIAALETKTASMSTLTDADGQPTVRFSGVNVQVVDGTGTTVGTPNGRGNLIVGYNEVSDATVPRNHTGSHNIVTGINQTYTSYGGLIAGLYNTVSAPYGSASGGQGNTASGPASAVSGGLNNEASGNYASLTGGFNSTAAGYASSVSGGEGNAANGAYSTVSGGPGRSISGAHGWVAGRFTGTSYTGNFNSP